MNRGYGQYCPIAKGAEIFAERWTPLIIRNLYLGCHTFSEIAEGLPRISATLLADRLRFLERKGIVERRAVPGARAGRYFLTAPGQELAEVGIELGTWAARWIELGPDDHDPYIVLWAWRKTVDLARLPRPRIVVRFDLRDRPRERFWLLLQRPEPELCVRPPGLEEDLVVATDAATLTHVHLGRLSMAEAERTGRWRVDGDARLVREFKRLGGLSRFAGVQSVAAGQ